MSARGFVFDLDGTLIDFVTIFDRILEATFGEFGLTMTPEKAKELEEMALHTLTGKSSKFVIVKLIWRIAREFGLGFRDKVRFLKTAGRNYREMIRDVELIPGAFEKVEALKKAGYKIAVVTTASREEVEHRFAHRPHLLDLFDFVVGRDSVKRMKPAPDGVLLVAREFGVSPSELVMVGDMTLDIEAGVNAGARTVGVLTGYGTKEQLLGAGADLVVNSVADIPDDLPPRKS
ncbi:MAG: HAD family hydrolase [Promethearchaeota archaeon]